MSEFKHDKLTWNQEADRHFVSQRSLKPPVSSALLVVNRFLCVKKAFSRHCKMSRSPVDRSRQQAAAGPGSEQQLGPVTVCWWHYLPDFCEGRAPLARVMWSYFTGCDCEVRAAARSPAPFSRDGRDTDREIFAPPLLSSPALLGSHLLSASPNIGGRTDHHTSAIFYTKYVL